MRPQTYTTRRGATVGTSAAWSRNHNTVRHTPKTLGSISNAMIVGMLVLIVGLIYVAQGTQATNYDYELSQLEDEISDLAVEKARLTSVAASENSTVANTMDTASVSGYAE